MKINGKVIRWEKLGKGGYNTTYLSREPFEYEIDGTPYNQRWVLKIPQKDRKDELFGKMNAPERAVRLWNQLNPNLPAIEVPELKGWIAPYINGKQASDEAVVQKQIELYRDHRRIVVDACGDHNFLSFEGEVICVDVDAAVHEQSPISRRIVDEVVELDAEVPNYEDYWHDYATTHQMPKSVQMTKTLLYLDAAIGPERIPDRLITAKNLEKLHTYQQQKKPLTLARFKRIIADKDYEPIKLSSMRKHTGFFESQAETECQVMNMQTAMTTRDPSSDSGDENEYSLCKVQ